jgi:NADPH-dependent glutamate synthase beta subunit-like oxidoreductase
VVQGLEFLDRARQGLVAVEGEDVVVFGGGNTAVDAARSALRLGARSVRIVYRRTQLEMPAIYEEVREALDEGVLFDELVAPVALRDSDTHLVVSCTRMRLGEPDESGRRRPEPDTRAGSKFELCCTRAILALGASGDRSILPEGAVIRGEDVLDDAAAEEPCRALLVGGDFAVDNGTVAAAIGSGRRAAWRIHAMLTGSPAEGVEAPEGEPIGADRIRLGHFDTMAQQRPSELPVADRRRNFDEVRSGLLPEQAACEAARCLSCGSCTHCDICRAHCPEGVLFRDGDGYRFDYDYCKGCGICVLECPRGALIMRQVGGA